MRTEETHNSVLKPPLSRGCVGTCWICVASVGDDVPLSVVSVDHQHTYD